MCHDGDRYVGAGQRFDGADEMGEDDSGGGCGGGVVTKVVMYRYREVLFQGFKKIW